MRLNLIIVAVLCALAVGWVYVSYSKAPKTTPKIENETVATALDPAPKFNYITLSGRTGTLEEHKGKVILLHFWASWCAPCIVEFPELIELAKQHQNELVILAVSSDTKKQDIKKFISRKKNRIPDNFIIIHDGDKVITQDLYSTFKLPETYLITPNLKIQKKYIGPQTGWDSKVWNNDMAKHVQ